MRNFWLRAAVALAACHSGADREVEHSRGPMWKFHITADEGILGMVSTGDTLYVGEILADHHKYTHSQIRVFSTIAEQRPLIFDEQMASFALARDGADVLAVWRGEGFGHKGAFSIITSSNHKSTPVEIPGYGRVAAVGAGGGWIVCADDACARIDRDRHVGEWHALGKLPQDLTLVACEGGPYLVATSVQMRCDASHPCEGSIVVRLDRDGVPLARTHLDAEIGQIASVHNDLVVHVLAMGPDGGLRRIRASDLSNKPLEEGPQRVSGDLADTPGGLLVVGHHDVRLWADGKLTTLESDLSRFLPKADPQDLAFRTRPDGLVHGWRWGNNAHDGEQDVVVWRPEPR